MTSESIEIHGEFRREKFRSGDFCIALIDVESTPDGDGPKTVGCKLNCEENELEEGLSYRFYGRWKKDLKWGEQFIARTFVRTTPLNRDGVIRYLMKAKGIGIAVARALYKKYQGNAVRRLREDPVSIAKEIPRLTEDRAEYAAAFFEAQKDLEEATIELVGLFGRGGFPKSLPRDVIKEWGNNGHERAKRNPYALMAFPGVGFAKADALYLRLGKQPAAIKRQLLAIWHTMNGDSNGHTWFDQEYICKALSERIGGAEAQPLKAIKLGMRFGSIHHRKTYKNWFSTSVRSSDEFDIAERVAYLESGKLAWPGVLMSNLSSHQEQQLSQALEKPVAVFAGGPGTGKTYSAARLIQRLLQLGSHDVAVLAPTGKAARRITEAMEEYGIQIKARTIHSYLGVEGYSDGRFTFTFNETRPVAERYIIVDEASMVDCPIMASLLRAMRDDGHLLLIGDTNQLAPVGHGAPLRDLIKAKVGYGELTEIRRNSGAIVETCARIRESSGLGLSQGPLDPGTGKNLVLYGVPDNAIAARIQHLLRSIRDRKIADPIWHVQVICAVNEKGDASRKTLNRILQQELNHANRQPKGFWRNDKIVCLRNQSLPAVTEHMDIDELDDDELQGIKSVNKKGETSLYIANGEVGRVIEDLPNKCIMEFFAPRRVVLFPKREGGEVEGFVLAYAISCHKSQGSEWPIVIVVLDSSGAAQRVCDRSWLYTAVSRAKQACLLVGRDRTAQSMTKHQKIHLRRTFLETRVDESRKWLKERERDHAEAGAIPNSVQDIGGRKGEEPVPLSGVAD